MQQIHAVRFIHAEGNGLKVDREAINGLLAKNKGELTIIAVLGKARGGKSTLLDLIIHHIIEQANSTDPGFLERVKRAVTGGSSKARLDLDYMPFNVGEGDEHITRGIDMAVIPCATRNYVFLDCQGLMSSEDVSLDLQYMLAIYMVADIIIYNQIQSLGADIWDKFSTFLAAARQFNPNTKPSIIFRLTNYQAHRGPIKQELLNAELGRFLEHRADQFGEAREALRLVFDKISIIATRAPNDEHRDLLSDKKFGEFMSIEKYGFAPLIHDIMVQVNLAPKHDIGAFSAAMDTLQANLLKLPAEWDTTRLDFYSTLAKSEVQKFLMDVTTDMRVAPKVDGTAADDKILTTRLITVNALLAAFDSQFAKVADGVKVPLRLELIKIITPPFEEAAVKSRTMAQAIIDSRIPAITATWIWPQTIETKPIEADHKFSFVNTLTKQMETTYANIANTAELKKTAMSMIDLLNIAVINMYRKVFELTYDEAKINKIADDMITGTLQNKYVVTNIDIVIAQMKEAMIREIEDHVGTHAEKFDLITFNFGTFMKNFDIYNSIAKGLVDGKFDMSITALAAEKAGNGFTTEKDMRTTKHYQSFLDVAKSRATEKFDVILTAADHRAKLIAATEEYLKQAFAERMYILGPEISINDGSAAAFVYKNTITSDITDIHPYIDFAVLEIDYEYRFVFIGGEIKWYDIWLKKMCDMFGADGFAIRHVQIKNIKKHRPGNLHGYDFVEMNYASTVINRILIETIVVSWSRCEMGSDEESVALGDIITYNIPSRTAKRLAEELEGEDGAE